MAAADIDLTCYETMPTPFELTELASRSRLVPIEPDAACFCLDPCEDCFCKAQLSRKRKQSPSPPRYQSGDETWVQSIRLFHPTDFEYTTVEMDCNLPFRAIFHQLCDDQRVKRKDVVFLWNRKRRRGGVQIVKLSDESVPWHIGMCEGELQTIECEFA
jgi:hypothetical protein